jgi:hypothetical protein
VLVLGGLGEDEGERVDKSSSAHQPLPLCSAG